MDRESGGDLDIRVAIARSLFGSDLPLCLGSPDAVVSRSAVISGSGGLDFARVGGTSHALRTIPEPGEASGTGRLRTSNTDTGLALPPPATFG